MCTIVAITMTSYAVFSRFYTADDSALLTGLLDQHAIPYTLDHEVNPLDTVYVGESPDPMFVLRLPPDRFKQVTGLLAAQARQDFNQPGFTHYFMEYDIPELEAVVNDPNDWNGYDLQMAELVLAQKNPSANDTGKLSTYSSSYQPEKIKPKWLVLGYMLCFFPLIGVFIGLSVIQAKKTLSNGETVNLYDKDSLWHGRVMVAAGAAFTVVAVISRMMNMRY